MARSEPKPRLDSYGKLLPELSEAQRRVTLGDAGNMARISLLHALIEDACRAVCRHGWYGNVQIRFSVIDGSLQSDIYAGLERNWKNQELPDAEYP